jgi:hypothetical protein
MPGRYRTDHTTPSEKIAFEAFPGPEPGLIALRKKMLQVIQKGGKTELLEYLRKEGPIAVVQRAGSQGAETSKRIKKRFAEILIDEYISLGCYAKKRWR